MFVKSQKLFISVALVTLLVLSMVPTIGFAQTQTTVQVDGLLVYEQPNATSNLIAVLSLGVGITQFDDVQNGFTKIGIPDGREGWAVLTVAGAPDGAPTTETVNTVYSDPFPFGEPAATPSSVVIEARGNVRIRQEPSVNAARLGFIGWGEQAFLLSYDNSGNWMQINYNGLVGWAAADWFRVVLGDVSTVGTGGVANAGAGTTTPVTTDTAGQNLNTSNAGNIIQSIGNVRIRQEPSVNATRLGFVPWGDTAVFLGTDPSGDWAFIDYNGLRGYSALVWWRFVQGATVEVTVTDTTTTETTTETTVTDGNVAATGVTLQALGNIRVRQTPSINGTRLTSMAWGENVSALAISADGNWVKVNYNGIIGWAARDWFRVLSGNIGGLPVE